MDIRNYYIFIENLLYSIVCRNFGRGSILRINFLFLTYTNRLRWYKLLVGSCEIQRNSPNIFYILHSSELLEYARVKRIKYMRNKIIIE